MKKKSENKHKNIIICLKNSYFNILSKVEITWNKFIKFFYLYIPKNKIFNYNFFKYTKLRKYLIIIYCITNSINFI